MAATVENIVDYLSHAKGQHPGQQCSGADQLTGSTVDIVVPEVFYGFFCIKYRINCYDRKGGQLLASTYRSLREFEVLNRRLARAHMPLLDLPPKVLLGAVDVSERRERLEDALRYHILDHAQSLLFPPLAKFLAISDAKPKPLKVESHPGHTIPKSAEKAIPSEISDINDWELDSSAIAEKTPLPFWSLADLIVADKGPTLLSSLSPLRRRFADSSQHADNSDLKKEATCTVARRCSTPPTSNDKEGDNHSLDWDEVATSSWRPKARSISKYADEKENMQM